MTILNFMISSIIYKLRQYKYARYITECKKKGMKIGDNTGIMPGCYFDSDYCFLISIGTNCTLSNDVFILAHDASMYRFLKYTKIAKVTIHDNCFIGAKAVILPGVSIGPNAIVSAGSVVTKDVPPNSDSAGNPAKVIKPFKDFLAKHENQFNAKNFLWLEDYLADNSLFNNELYVVKKKDKDFIKYKVNNL